MHHYEIKGSGNIGQSASGTANVSGGSSGPDLPSLGVGLLAGIDIGLIIGAIII